MPSKTIVAIIAVALLELTALLCNVDGQILAISVASIADLGGFALGKK